LRPEINAAGEYFRAVTVARWHSYFLTKNPNLGKFWKVLQWKMLLYYMAIRSIFQPFGKFYGHLVYFYPFWYILPVLVYFYLFWYIFTRFGMLYLEKSCNPKTS
jgi:hypothetical protein